jgi:hypothetical protein
MSGDSLSTNAEGACLFAMNGTRQGTDGVYEFTVDEFLAQGGAAPEALLALLFEEGPYSCVSAPSSVAAI